MWPRCWQVAPVHRQATAGIISLHLTAALALNHRPIATAAGSLFKCIITCTSPLSWISRHQTRTSAYGDASRHRALSTTNLEDSTALTIEMPNPPLRYDMVEDGDGPPRTVSPLDLTTLSSQIVEAEDRRQQAYDLSRKMLVALVHARREVGYQAPSQLQATLTTFLEVSPLISSPGGEPLLTVPASRQPREANLSQRMEDWVRLMAFQHFLQTATLLPPVEYCTDEEYLAGAGMGLCQDLYRYGLGRATVRDVPSVQAATDLVAAILDFLLQLDFRNGPLRRKYDGVKYSLKGLETLLYELAVTGAGAFAPPARERRDSLLPQAALQEIQTRMDHRDQLREQLIKKCRDSQKAAKQAIFAMHRGDRPRATQLLKQCLDGIQQELWPLVTEDPPLRGGGSFTEVVEEYVEARLFAAWLYGRDIWAETHPGGPSEDTSPRGILLQPDEFDIALEPEEYVGGLCDLTGEIGRYAVQQGTARHLAGVKLCLHTNDAILTSLESLERIPGSGAGKKMEAARRSVEKLERMLYEMSLSEATGGRSVQSDMDADIPEGYGS